MIKILWLLGSVLLGLVLPIQAAGPPGIIVVPVVDVRRSPSPPSGGSSDDLQETQALLGEPVTIRESSGSWVRIGLPEQAEFTHNSRWEGYPGWVRASAVSPLPAAWQADVLVLHKWLPLLQEPGGAVRLQLPITARLQLIGREGNWAKVRLPDGSTGWVVKNGLEIVNRRPEAGRVRHRILRTAEFFLGDPYVWGGRSPFREDSPDVLSGIDCSGLVHLSYRAQGFIIPRDAHEQYMKARRLWRSQLQPADLIFVAQARRPDRIVHVALYAGGDDLVEAPQTGQSVHRTTFQNKFGRPLVQIEPGRRVKDRVLFFGRLLPP